MEIENVEHQSHLVASDTRSESQTVCVASTSSDGLSVVIKEEPLSEDTYEVLHYGKNCVVLISTAIHKQGRDAGPPAPLSLFIIITRHEMNNLVHVFDNS